MALWPGIKFVYQGGLKLLKFCLLNTGIKGMGYHTEHVVLVVVVASP